MKVVIVSAALRTRKHPGKDYEVGTKKGLRPNLPARTYRPTASEILQFCCRERGGTNYIQLEAALRVWSLRAQYRDLKPLK